MRLALESAAFYFRNLRTRLPFRYGVVTLTHFPLLHVTVVAAPGYGVAFDPDLDGMIPLDSWRFDAMEADV